MNFFGIIALLAQGVGYTVAVTLACCATGLAVGLLVAGLRRLAWPGIAPLLDGFTYIFRGVPVLVLLFLVYFGLPSIGIKVSPLPAMMLSLGLIAAAYLAEVFRGALDSVDPGEILAAQAMGMTRLQILLYIEMPQMLRFAVPGMVNEFTTVLKYSPFAYTVGIPEITKQAMTLASTTLRGIEVYLAVGILYFAIYRILLVGVHWLERRYHVPGLSQA
ncbi:MAG: amino acid ABC transporter permease [Sulfuricella sp.]|nr:amino acid ABC transporter permease [Sulfuricella sp.]